MTTLIQIASTLCLVVIVVGLPVMFGLLVLMTRDVVRNIRRDKEDRRWYEEMQERARAERKRRAETPDANGYTLGDYVAEMRRRGMEIPDYEVDAMYPVGTNH